MKIRYIFLMLSCFLSTTYAAQEIVEAAETKGIPTKAIFKSFVEEKKELLKALTDEVKQLEEERGKALKTIQNELNENKSRRSALEKSLKQEPNDEFLGKKLLVINEIQDTLNDLARTWDGILKRLNDHRLLLEKYLSDPESKEYIRDFKKTVGSYTFEDLDELYQKSINQQKFVEQLKKRKDSITKELKSLMQAADGILEEHKEKAQQETRVAVETQKKPQQPFGFSPVQKAELSALEELLFKFKKELADLQVKEKQRELTLVNDELFIESMRLEVLNELQQKIRSSIVVNAEHIEFAFQELEKKRQENSALKARYNDEITKIHKIREDEGKALTALSTRYGISLGNDLNTWSIEPKKSIESYRVLTEMGMLNTYIQLLDARETYFSALIAQEQERINYIEDAAHVKETYYKIVASKFSSEDEIAAEIKRYANKYVATETSLKSYRAKKEEADTALLKLQNETVERLKKRKLELHKQKDTLFKDRAQDYARTLQELDKAEEYTAFHIDMQANTIKAYTEIIAILEKIAAHSKFILAELETITIWYRPEYAITWAGVQNVRTDIKAYFSELYTYIKQFNGSTLASAFKKIAKKPLFLLFKILILVLCILAFFVLARQGYRLSIAVRTALQQYAPTFGLFLAMILEFGTIHATGLGIWTTLYLFVIEFLSRDPYLVSAFYLLSIPYLLYMAARFITFFKQFNEAHNHGIISNDFQHRFFILVSIFLYSSITLFFFRKAFLLAKFSKSELPTILLALQFIIAQACIVFLITKDHILSFIPTKFAFGQLIYKAVNQYYYIVLFCIVLAIILSNPYIGYGRLVFYLITGIISTVILIRLLLGLHSLIKRGASMVFFSTQDDVVRERFSSAKTWFGIVIIISFLMVGFIGFLVGAKIWGWHLVTKDVIKWFNLPILGIGKGTSHPLTGMTILTILLFVLVGFLIAYAFNRFVLEKIFDLMLVESGVQNAITNLLRYVIVAAAIILGLQSVGFGGLLTYIYVLILGIGYLIQNPLNDFVAYFIILVQRPIKVGDYIRIDDELKGVVRKVTPKSVVLRRENSVTIVVPNTQIINKSVINWNYAKNFIAFDDILITISYKENPAVVKDLLASVVDAHPQILKNPKPVIRLHDFNEHGFQFKVRGFLSSAYTMEQWDIASDIRLAIVASLKQHDIEIAIPVYIIASSPKFLPYPGPKKE